LSYLRNHHEFLNETVQENIQMHQSEEKKDYALLDFN